MSLRGKTLIFEGKVSIFGGFWDWCSRTRWRITTTYIESDKGVCCSHSENLQLFHVQEMWLIESKCGSLYEEIVILTTDESIPKLSIKGIPNSQKVFLELKKAVNAIQNKSDLQIQGFETVELKTNT